jgi:hypothetical protein
MARAWRDRRPRPSPVTPPTIYEVGAILRLPSKDQIPGDLQSRTEIDDGCFDHPALIIWIDQGSTKAAILIITSFKGRDLLEKHGNNKAARLDHLPIHPNNPHPDNGELLYLEGNAALPKKSYVKTGKQHIVDLSVLQSDRSIKGKLRKESLTILIKYIKFTPPVEPPPVFPAKSSTLHSPQQPRTLYSDAPTHQSGPVEYSNVHIPQARARAEVLGERPQAPPRSTTVAQTPSIRPAAYHPYRDSSTYGTIPAQSANTHVRHGSTASVSYPSASTYSTRSPTYYSPRPVLPISNYDSAASGNEDTPSCLRIICGGLVVGTLLGVAFVAISYIKGGFFSSAIA